MRETDVWLKQILDGTAPAPLRDMASKGLVPFPPVELLLALAVLAQGGDEVIRRQSVETAARMPRSIVLEAAGDRGSDPRILRLFGSSHAADAEVLALLAGGSAAPDDLLWKLAASEDARVLEALARNQERLRLQQDLLARLIGNPHLGAGVRGYLREERDRLRAAEKVAVEEELSKEEVKPEIEFHEVLVKEFDREDDVLPPVQRQKVKEQRRVNIHQMIRQMTMPEKIVLAFKGNKEARNLLIRDNNKMVCTKVLESPRLSDSEVEMYAKMTNVSDDVLRGIALKKEWMGKMAIMKALVMNPKTPVGIGLPLVNRLGLRDLELLGRNRNVPEVIRTTAVKLAKMRKETRSRGGGGH